MFILYFDRDSGNTALVFFYIRCYYENVMVGGNIKTEKHMFEISNFERLCFVDGHGKTEPQWGG